MKESTIFPWMQSQWQQLLTQYASDRLPHAILLAGPEGIGKFHFARTLSQVLLCDQIKRESIIQISDFETLAPCGKCNGCQLYNAGTHPDFFPIQPESEGKQIAVAAIREINHFVSLTSQFSEFQIVIISPAETMNRNSANALLKTLEEPRPGKIIILVSSNPGRLLPTIRSRCQQISFALPNTQNALTWLSERGDQLQSQQWSRLLALAGGAPLLAYRYANEGKLELYDQLLQSFEKLGKKQANPVAEAKKWESAGLTHSVKWLYLWVSSLIHLKSQGRAVDTSMDKNVTFWREPSLDYLIEQVSFTSLHHFLDRVTEMSRIANTSINAQLAIESLLIDWTQRLK